MGYTRAEAKAIFFYGHEEFEEIWCFAPTAGEVADVPSGWAIGIHGGLFFKPGDEAMSMTGTGWSGVADALRAQGCYVFVIDHQPVASNFDWRITPISYRLWPGPLLSVLKALSLLLSNTTWDSEYGPLFLTGAAASLSKNKVALFGHSSGADLAMLAALVPSGFFPIQGALGLGTDNFGYHEFPRAMVVVNKIGQIAWTNYVFPTDGGLGPVYDGDIHQALSTDGSCGPWLSWTATPMRIKRLMSPVHWLRQGYAEQRNVAFYHHYLNSADPYGSALVAEDYDADTPQNDFAGLKAFADPHCRFQLWGAAMEWTKAGVPNRCVLGQKLVTYDKSTGTWTEGSNVGDIATDTVAYINSRWATAV